MTQASASASPTRQRAETTSCGRAAQDRPSRTRSGLTGSAPPPTIPSCPDGPDSGHEKLPVGGQANPGGRTPEIPVGPAERPLQWGSRIQHPRVNPLEGPAGRPGVRLPGVAPVRCHAGPEFGPNSLRALPLMSYRRARVDSHRPRADSVRRLRRDICHGESGSFAPMTE